MSPQSAKCNKLEFSQADQILEIITTFFSPPYSFVDPIISRYFSKQIRLKDLREESLFLLKRLALNLQDFQQCSCPWTTVVAYNQVTLLSFYPIFDKKPAYQKCSRNKWLDRIVAIQRSREIDRRSRQRERESREREQYSTTQYVVKMLVPCFSLLSHLTRC